MGLSMCSLDASLMITQCSLDVHSMLAKFSVHFQVIGLGFWIPSQCTYSLVLLVDAWSTRSSDLKEEPKITYLLVLGVSRLRGRRRSRTKTNRGPGGRPLAQHTKEEESRQRGRGQFPLNFIIFHVQCI